MSAQKLSLWDHIAAYPGRTAFVLLYCPLLAVVLTTVSFSGENAARRYIAQVANEPPAPLPALHFVEWPKIAMRRDPFQPMATPTKPASSKPASPRADDDASSSGPFRFVSSYSDGGQRYVLGRSATDQLARFRVGDEVDGGVIRRIDAGRVILDSGGQRKVVEILRAAVERANSP